MPVVVDIAHEAIDRNAGKPAPQGDIRGSGTIPPEQPEHRAESDQSRETKCRGNVQRGEMRPERDAAY